MGTWQCARGRHKGMGHPSKQHPLLPKDVFLRGVGRGTIMGMPFNSGTAELWGPSKTMWHQALVGVQGCMERVVCPL
eukprot:6784865-Ditylum_brightwellii.AAC.1